LTQLTPNGRAKFESKIEKRSVQKAYLMERKSEGRTTKELKIRGWVHPGGGKIAWEALGAGGGGTNVLKGHFLNPLKEEALIYSGGEKRVKKTHARKSKPLTSERVGPKLQK